MKSEKQVQEQEQEAEPLEYDFREVLDMAGAVSAEIDDLGTQELVKVHEVIQKIKEQTKEQKHKWFQGWFAVVNNLKCGRAINVKL